jgi:hypothetical protein
MTLPCLDPLATYDLALGDLYPKESQDGNSNQELVSSVQFTGWN